MQCVWRSYTIHPSVGSIDGLTWQPFPPEWRAMFCYVDELDRPMCNLYSIVTYIR